MPNDIKSQGIARFVSPIAIGADGSYPLDPIDTEGLFGIAFYMASLYLQDGSYRLAFDESDNGVDWSEVPNESLIGGVTITADFIIGVPFGKVGLFSVRRYIRPKIIATDVTVGVGGIGVLSIETPRIQEATL